MDTKGYFTVPMLEYRYVEFLRVDSEKDANTVAAAVLGAGNGHGAYTEHFGINLLQYKGFYVEVGYAAAPEGPITPITIPRILVLRQTHSAMAYRPQLIKVEGYVNQSGKMAWVEALKWEEQIGDHFAEDLRKKMAGAEARRPVQQTRGKVIVNGKEVSLDELADLVRDVGETGGRNEQDG